ncbi:MAG: hypothetical protein ACPHY8_01085 [Patescibacteria group bacterium]
MNFTNSGSQIIINSSAGELVPYIVQQSQKIVAPNTTQNITIV